MNSTAQIILNDINNKIANRNIFKYNREFLIQSLIIALNKMIFSMTFRLNVCNQVIEQYRTILKFIFSNNNEKGIIPIRKEEIVNDFCDMFVEFMDKYNPVRNYLDQVIIGIREMSFDEENKTYFEEHFDSFSNYSRTIDKVKDFPSEKIKGEVSLKMLKYLMYNANANIFRDYYLKTLLDECVKICWLDSEIQFEHNFCDFKYSDIILFCASLQYIASYYIATLGKNPYAVMDVDKMIDGIARLTNLERSKVETFMNYQTYDYEYQKDRLTLIQGFIKIDNKYYFNPYTISIGLLPLKMIRLIVDYDYKKYEKDFSIIAKRKEEQMIEAIIEKLQKYDVDIKTNYKYMDNNKTRAEYDLLVLDNITNDLYIFECKWYFVGDGEREHNNLDKKIEKAIEDRNEKDKFIINDLERVSKDLFNNKKINNVYELLISQNFSGNKEHSMIVIDYETLQWSIDNNSTFKELMDYIISKEYLQSIPLNNMKVDVEIEKYKFSFYRIYFSD